MKKLLASTILFAIFLFSATAFAQRTTQVADMNDLTGMERTASQGAAWLKRSADDLEGRAMVNVDGEGIPYTVWWVIFNHPKECLDTNGVVLDPVTGDIVTWCNLDDLFVEAVGGAVINASGAISASNGEKKKKKKKKKDGGSSGRGVVNTSFELEAGEAAGGDNEPCCFGLLEGGNGNGAEVHIVVDEHLDFASWPIDLTTPQTGHRGAVFLSLEE